MESTEPHIPNFHTHFLTPGAPALYNLLPPYDLPVFAHQYLSAGIHPWFIDNHLEIYLNRIEDLLRQNNLRAVGETGLDKIKGPHTELQTRIFEIHIEWAQNAHLPLVIHCVKAHPEILALLKKHNFREPVIFHGFRSRWNVARPLVEAGYYLSFGPAVLKPSVFLEETIRLTPLEQLLIETDDSQVSIKEIFQAIKNIRQISDETLTAHLAQKFNVLFS